MSALGAASAPEHRALQQSGVVAHHLDVGRRGAVRGDSASE